MMTTSDIQRWTGPLTLKGMAHLFGIPNKPFVDADSLATWLQRPTGQEGVSRFGDDLGAIAIATNAGLTKTVNENRVIVMTCRGLDRRRYLLAILAEGIGGVSDGAHCAALTAAYFADGVAEHLRHGSGFYDALMVGSVRADQAVHCAYKGNAGSTLSAFLISSSGSLHWLIVGHSRIYVGGRNDLRPVGIEDSIGLYHQTRHSSGQLILALGSRFFSRYIGSEKFVPESGICMVSDGANSLPTELQARIYSETSEPLSLADHSMALSKLCQGDGNATAIGAQSLQDIRKMLMTEQPDEVWDAFGKLD